MILPYKYREILNDYIEVIKEKEEVLWEVTMGELTTSTDTITPTDTHAPKNGFIAFSCWLAFIFLLFGAVVFSCLFVILGFVLQRISDSMQPIGNSYRNKKTQNTQYIVTNKGIIFILGRKGKFHIHNIPYTNIKKIIVNGRNKKQGNIFVIPQEPVNFNTYNYKNNKPSLYISLFNIPNPKEVEAILQQHL